MVKQVSIFLENRAGRLHEVTSLLAGQGFNIRALSVADTSDFGILRLIVDKPEKAFDLLKKENYTVSMTDVVALEVADKPGGLSYILGLFDKNQINVEYMYAFLAKIPEKAILIFRFDDNKAVLAKLKNQDVKLISAEELYKM